MSSCTMSRKIMLMWTCIHTLVNTMEYNSSTQLFALCLFKSLTICLCFSMYQKAHTEIFHCMKNHILTEKSVQGSLNQKGMVTYHDSFMALGNFADF